MSETTGNENIGEPDQRDLEREDPSIAGKPEVPASGDEAPSAPEGEQRQTSRLDESDNPTPDTPDSDPATEGDEERVTSEMPGSRPFTNP